MNKKHVYTCLMTLISAQVGAYQKVTIGESTPMPEVVISNKQMNRIQIEGLRIKDITAPEDTFDIRGNEETGTVYIRLLDAEKEGPFAVSLVSEKKDHFDLILRPKDVPMEVIHITKEEGAPSVQVPEDWAPQKGQEKAADPKELLQEVLKQVWQGKGGKLDFAKPFYELEEGDMKAVVTAWHRLNGYVVATLKVTALQNKPLDMERVVAQLKDKARAVMYRAHKSTGKVVVILNQQAVGELHD